MTDPFFIIGAPRSGTSFLVEVLNRHPTLFVTQETRVMTWVSRALTELPADARVLHHAKARFLSHLRRELPGMIDRFYRALGAPEGARWGDKNPYYADGLLDVSTLSTIDQLYPASQFIHLVRDGRAVIASLVVKGWASNLDHAVDLWRRHIRHAREFGDRVGPARSMDVRYENLVDRADQTVRGVLRFLGVPEHPDVTAYLREQEVERTPISGPITPTEEIGTPRWQRDLSEQQIRLIDHAIGDDLVELGYESKEWLVAVLDAGEPALPVDADAMLARVRSVLDDPNSPTELLREVLAALADRVAVQEAVVKAHGKRVGQIIEALEAERRMRLEAGQLPARRRRRT